MRRFGNSIMARRCGSRPEAAMDFKRMSRGFVGRGRDKASRRKSGVRDFRKALITNGHSPNLRMRDDDPRLTPIGVSIPRAPECERIKEADVEPGEIVDVARYNDHIIDQRRGGDQDILVQGVRSLAHQARVQSKHRGIRGKNEKKSFRSCRPRLRFRAPWPRRVDARSRRDYRMSTHALPHSKTNVLRAHFVALTPPYHSPHATENPFSRASSSRCVKQCHSLLAR